MSNVRRKTKSRSVPVCKLCGIRHLPIADMESAHFHITTATQPEGLEALQEKLAGFNTEDFSPSTRLKALEELMVQVLRRLDERDKDVAEPGPVYDTPKGNVTIPLEERLSTGFGFIDKYVADAERTLADVKDVVRTLRTITGIQ